VTARPGEDPGFAKGREIMTSEERAGSTGTGWSGVTDNGRGRENTGGEGKGKEGRK